MLLPGVVLVALFSYAPILGWVMAFKEYQLGMSIFSGRFIGFEQFKAFFANAGDAAYVIRNTICINLLTIVINLTSACAFAVLLNEIKTGLLKKAVQSFSFFPFFISWIITYSIFNTFLSSQSGVLNHILVDLHLTGTGIDFLGNPRYAWQVILFVSFWKYIGYNSVIFLSSISSIDQSQYEAAKIDGAGRFGEIFYITLPGLAPTLVVLLILNSGWIFSSNFEQYFLFTNSMNWERMEVLDVYIYKYGLKLLDFSYATAVGIVKTIASIIMLFIVNSAAKRLNGRSII